MFLDSKTYTVESVTSGHPDKLCDRISDAILDECLRQDPNSRVAVESFGGHGLLVIGGEVTSTARVDYGEIGRRIYRETGYHDPLHVIANVVVQSPDIALGVDTGGAGDQGIMYGYACSDTPEFLPAPIVLVHKLTHGLENLRVQNAVPWLKPDGKTQITVADGAISAVLVSTQHDDGVDGETIKKTLIEKLIAPIIGDVSTIEILVNPTGRFVQGGFEADTGLTGRKIMVDTYCGLVPHGGGCFSGKDPSKVDRSAAYMCRYVAKNVVASGRAKKCLVSVAYAIGRAEPLMIEARDEHGKDLSELVREKFDFTPKAITAQLDLKKPIYFETASYGHFGNPHFPWEKIISW